jgi:hypothetical protein
MKEKISESFLINKRINKEIIENDENDESEDKDEEEFKIFKDEIFNNEFGIMNFLKEISKTMGLTLLTKVVILSFLVGIRTKINSVFQLNLLNQKSTLYFILFIFLIFFDVLVTLLHRKLKYLVTGESLKIYFDKLSFSIINSRMNLFETNPFGRLMLLFNTNTYSVNDMM